jgi:Alkylmercury lyase.
LIRPRGGVGGRAGSVRFGPAAFCDQVHLFTGAHAAGPWLDRHPGISVVWVADAYRLGQQLDGVLQRGCAC